MKWYLKVVRDNYANFSGRARRKEYWMFVLFNLIFIYGGMIVLGFMSVALESPLLLVLIYIYVIGAIIPTLAVAVRRMHDVGKSGWYMFIPIYSFILAVTEGERKTNQYGPDPKSTENKEINTTHTKEIE